MAAAALALLSAHAVSGYHLPTLSARIAPPKLTLAAPRAPPPHMLDFDSNTLIAIGTLIVGLGGGVGLIAFTESAGKRNEQSSNSQPCVECTGKQVTTCTICQGSGSDPYASLVAGVREMTGSSSSGEKIVVEDWASGPTEIVMYEEILSRYPPKVTESVCEGCSGRGIVVCDNCRGTGIQPRFLERYSPDDFMD
ncbi:hypothetical protein AB1Y20_019816 [Prymnesium parvum]|uniref:AtTam37 zinc finger domain-containing protein n=1 Tax=Prymnesium parvum TaxID=97485 RepID=A0AB34JSX2_PRYPA